MFATLRTLFDGASARAEDRVKDTFAVELIDQKIRESEGQLKAAKSTLASLIQRHRSEQRQLETLNNRVKTMTTRATEALKADRQDMALQAADAIATMENEALLRQQTVDRLDMQVMRLRGSVETAHRRGV